MKFEKDGNVIEVENPNTFNIFVRDGFEKVEEDELDELEALRNKAKEMGIKSTHTMKQETLIEKITELENKE